MSALKAKIYGEIVAQIQVNGTTQNVSCSADTNPNYQDLFDHHNPAFLVAWIIGGACALISLLICFHQLWLFSRADRSNLRSAYMGVVMMAPVFAITNYLSMFFPRASLMFELVQHMYEAQALTSFGYLMFDLATDGEPDVNVAKQIMVTRMAMYEPKKLDAVPPCCILSPCVKAVHMDEKRLDKLMTGITVFKVGVPLCAAIRLWVALETKEPRIQEFAKIGLFLGENLSMSYTIYCLFQLYIATHDLLHEYNSTAKFVAIKAILGIAVLQSMIINVVVHKFVPEDAHFSREMQSEFWSDFALVCEAVILAWMHRDAYPWKELDDKDGKRKRRMEEAKQLALIRSALPEHHHKDPEGGKPHHDVEMLPASRGPPPYKWNPENDKRAWPDEARSLKFMRRKPLPAKIGSVPKSPRSQPRRYDTDMHA